jgi:hypothetical protein
LGDDERAALSAPLLFQYGLGPAEVAPTSAWPDKGRSVADVIHPSPNGADLDADDAASLAAMLDHIAAMTITATDDNEAAIVTYPLTSNHTDLSVVDAALSRPAVADVLAAAADALPVREVLIAAWLHRLFENWLQRQPTGQRVLDATPAPTL